MNLAPDEHDRRKAAIETQMRERREAIEREAIAAFVCEVWRVAEAEKLTISQAIMEVCKRKGIAP